MSKPKSPEELFAGRHFDREVIIVCVRWYLRYKLGLRDLVENTKNDPGAHATGSSNPALRVSPYGTVEKTLTERHCRLSGVLVTRIQITSSARYSSPQQRTTTLRSRP